MDVMDRTLGVPNLPQELVDHILDYLEGDGASLRACALVSQSWSFRSQSLLWRTVCIEDAFVSPSSPFRTMLSAAPHICKAIHVLETRSSSNDLEDLASLFDSLPNLHTIRLQLCRLLAVNSGILSCSGAAHGHSESST